MRRYDSYKDSGVDWIGEIPSHWIKGKWGYYFNSGMGQTILKEDLIEDGETPVYSATEEDRIFGFIDNPHLMLDSGDLIIPARGNSIGHVKLVRSKSTTTQTTIYSKPYNPKILSNYTYYYCKGNKTNLFPFVQTAIPQITVNEISSNPIIVPPLSEQQQIVSYLDEHTQLIDKTISVEESRIELLKEYRQSLISEVVTGKIDVCQDNGIPWFQKPVPKVTIHKFETPINGREAIIGTIPPIWGKDVYDIVLDNLEIVNSLFTSDLQFELISKYLIPVGTDPDDCYLLLKDNLISGILYFKVYYPSRNEDYGYEPKGTLFEIVNSEIEISIIEKARHWVFDDLMEKGFSSFLLYYRKSYGKSSDDVLTLKEIKEKLSNG